MSKRGKMQAAPSPTVAAKMTITAFVDRPPVFDCNPPDILAALRLLGVGLATVINAFEQEKLKKAQADPVDKKREYLGPRTY